MGAMNTKFSEIASAQTTMDKLDTEGAQILRGIPDDAIMRLVAHNDDDFHEVTKWINEMD